MSRLTLTRIAGPFAICRFDPKDPLPKWVFESDFFSVTRTAEELSIVCRQDLAPDGTKCEGGWGCLKVEGPLDFSLTGVLASLAGSLAEARISIFALSTFDTDYLLVKANDIDNAVVVLSKAGYSVR